MTSVWRERLGVLGLALIPALVKIVAFGSYPGGDDSFIHLAVAHNVASGLGWGANPHEPVNLSSSPLFTAMAVVADGRHVIGIMQFVSMLASVVALVMLYVAARQLGRSIPVAFVVLALGAGNLHLWRWTGTVIETSLGVMFVAIATVLYLLILRRDDTSFVLLVALGVVLGLGLITRFETALLLPLVATGLLLEAGRRALPRIVTLGAVMLAVVAPWLIYAQHTFGTIVPSTFKAKTRGTQLIDTVILKSELVTVITAFGIGIAVAVIALVLATGGDSSRFDPGSVKLWFARNVTIIGLPVGLFAFYYLKAPDLQSPARYYLPALWSLPLLIGYGLTALTATISATVARTVLVATTAVSLVFAAGVTQARVATPLRRFDTNYLVAMRGGADFLQVSCGPNDRVLIFFDIGVMSRTGTGGCEIVDGGWLATPSLLHKTPAQMLAIVRPRFVVESLGKAEGDYLSLRPTWKLAYTRAFRPSSTQDASNHELHLNIYELPA